MLLIHTLTECVDRRSKTYCNKNVLLMSEVVLLSAQGEVLVSYDGSAVVMLCSALLADGERELR